MKTNVAPKNKE
jgi:hypothetical protein